MVFEQEAEAELFCRHNLPCSCRMHTHDHIAKKEVRLAEAMSHHDADLAHDDGSLDLDLQPLVGKHMIYTYENGWEYEVYYKSSNPCLVDYRVLSGLVGGRWVKDQPVNARHLGPPADHRFMVDWAEPTGTTVCQVVDLSKRTMDTVIFFPRWVAQDPAATVCFQNEHLERIRARREAGPIFPLKVVNERGYIHTMRDVGPGNESVISGAPPPPPPYLSASSAA